MHTSYCNSNVLADCLKEAKESQFLTSRGKAFTCLFHTHLHVII